MAVQLFDLMQLRFDPVDVMLLVNDEMFDQLTCGVVLSIEADLIPGLRTVGAACFQSEIVLGLLHDVRSRVGSCHRHEHCARQREDDLGILSHNSSSSLQRQLILYTAITKKKTKRVPKFALNFEQVSDVSRGDLCDLLQRNAFNFGYSLGDQPHVRWLIAFAAMRHRSEIRRVGFDKYFF